MAERMGLQLTTHKCAREVAPRQIVAMKIHARFIRAREYSLVLLECSTGRFPIACYIRILLPVENSLDL